MVAAPKVLAGAGSPPRDLQSLTVLSRSPLPCQPVLFAALTMQLATRLNGQRTGTVPQVIAS